jgi:nucleoid DNA-binding protein
LYQNNRKNDTFPEKIIDIYNRQKTRSVLGKEDAVVPQKDMNKKELAKEMSRRHSMTTVEAKKVIDLLQEITEEALERGEEVRVAGFGIFRVIIRKPRTAHNPVTGEAVEVPERKGITFKPSSELKRMIRKQ